jgi:hypothetical protein
MPNLMPYGLLVLTVGPFVRGEIAACFLRQRFEIFDGIATRGLLSPSEQTPAAQPDDAHSVLRLNYETLKGLISLASPTVAKFTHYETHATIERDRSTANVLTVIDSFPKGGEELEQVFSLQGGKKIAVSVTECEGGYQVAISEEGLTGQTVVCTCGNKTITKKCPVFGRCECLPRGNSPRIVCTA